jgi:hypothetical protein
VVIAGSFNAAIAALMWSDVFQNNTNGKVKIIADAGLYLNALNEKNNRTVI